MDNRRAWLYSGAGWAIALAMVGAWLLTSPAMDRPGSRFAAMLAALVIAVGVLRFGQVQVNRRLDMLTKAAYSARAVGYTDGYVDGLERRKPIL